MHKLLKPLYTLRWHYGTCNVLAMRFIANTTSLYLACSAETTRNAQVTSFTRPCYLLPLSTCQTGQQNNFVRTNGFKLCPLLIICTTVAMAVAYASSGYAEVPLQTILERADLRPKIIDCTEVLQLMLLPQRSFEVKLLLELLSVKFLTANFFEANVAFEGFFSQAF